jgi:hypothetical protein
VLVPPKTTVTVAFDADKSGLVAVPLPPFVASARRHVHDFSLQLMDHCDLDPEIAISPYLFASILRLIAKPRSLPAVISTEAFDRLSPTNLAWGLTNERE